MPPANYRVKKLGKTPLWVLNTPNALFFDLQGSQTPTTPGVLRCRTRVLQRRAVAGQPFLQPITLLRAVDKKGTAYTVGTAPAVHSTGGPP